MTIATRTARKLMSSIKLDVALAKAAFKTAIAATASSVLAQELHMEYQFYAAIAAIIVMAPTTNSTQLLGIQRLIGTAIGAVVGAIFSVVAGSHAWALGVSVFFTIYLTSAGKCPEAAKLAGYVSAIVILSQSHNPWLYAWGRFLETLLGIGVALLVNRCLFPTVAKSN
jgi:uncharacterized membrane protein YgaE (UPF0421/DUF939 family)